ncbi:MAG TPA: carbohydrate ABC transporter permease [Firmicutes bacterium]|nr:carbohydrate ABC transporter permease [Bacillota bacterium]
MVKDTSVSSVILDIVIYVVLILLMIVTLYPIIYILSVSLSSQAAYEAGEVVLWPVGINLEAYKEVLTGGTVPMSFLQAVINTLLYTVISLFMTTTLAYPLSRSKDRVPFHGFITKLVVFTMFFTAGMIPMYLIVQKVGLLNTRWALIIPVAITTYNLVVMRSFFESVPVELEEAAFIDGANEITIFAKIILPLSKAALATVGLFYAVSQWNQWFNAMLYLSDRVSELYPLQYIIRQIIMENQIAAEAAAAGELTQVQTSTVQLKYATLFVSIVPMLCVYPFIQKYFVKGVMVGSVKG